MEVGDVLRLKSGGPNMVVTMLEPLENAPDRVHVIWIDADEQPQSMALPEACFASTTADVNRQESITQSGPGSSGSSR